MTAASIFLLIFSRAFSTEGWMYARHTAARTGLHKVLCWPMCTRFIMNSEFSVSRLSAPLIALFVTFAALHAPVQAAEDLAR